MFTMLHFSQRETAPRQTRRRSRKPSKLRQTPRPRAAPALKAQPYTSLGGRYRLDSTLLLIDSLGNPAQNVTIEGDGHASFLAVDSDGGDAIRGTGVSNIAIQKLRIDSNFGTAKYARGIVINGSQFIALRDLEIASALFAGTSYHAGIWMQGVTDVTIQNNFIHDIGTDDGASWMIAIGNVDGGTVGDGGTSGTTAAARVTIRGNRLIGGNKANYGIAVEDARDFTSPRTTSMGSSAM